MLGDTRRRQTFFDGVVNDQRRVQGSSHRERVVLHGKIEEEFPMTTEKDEQRSRDTGCPRRTDEEVQRHWASQENG